MIPHPYLIGAGVLGLGAWYLLRPKKAAPPAPYQSPYAAPAAPRAAAPDPFAGLGESPPEYAPYFPEDPKYGPRVQQGADVPQYAPYQGPAYVAPEVPAGYDLPPGAEYVGPAAGSWDEEPVAEEESDDWADPSAWFSGRRYGTNLLAEARRALGV